MVTGKEKASYGLYFLGQNIFYMLIFMYMNTYFTDVGISVAAVAVIALIVKVWDAVNDPLFGGLMDKIQFKKGKFLPWLRISLVGIRDMVNYLVHNKYLLLYYVAFLIIGPANVGSVWGLYIARYCVGNEAIQSITGILGMLPSILLGMFVPLICRKVDKFKVYYLATAASAVLIAVTWIMGYQNLPVYLLGCVLACIPAGFTAVLGYMFTPDCCEYGQYKTGNSLPGITFAAQTFFAKLQSALVTAFGAMVLGLIGFVEGEGAVQAADFAQKMWNCSKFLPLAGTIIALVILRFYKLNDHDVQLMAKVNNGEMSREEAEAQMINKY